mgnify:CR=1 FL=1
MSISYTSKPACRFYNNGVCKIASEYFGKPVYTSTAWCNGPCLQHNGPFDGRSLDERHKLYFMLRSLLRQYTSFNEAYVKKLAESYKKPVNLCTPYQTFDKILAALPNVRVLFTGSLLTKTDSHKDYDIVIVGEQLPENLPTHIDGILCDYFLITKPGVSFYAATFDSFTKTLYTSAWCNIVLQTVPSAVTVVKAATENLDSILHELFVDRNLSAHQALNAVEALFFGERVTDEVEKARALCCDSCDKLRVTPDTNQKYCGACGCNVGSGLVFTLCKYKENLPKWGCKHPERAKGKGWQV